MVIKIAAFLFVCAALVSGLPQGGKPGPFKARTSSVPNRANAFQRMVVPQQPRRNVSGTKRVEGCGVAPLAPSKESRLYGGRDAVPHEYPWNVVVWMDHSWWCGGVLISDEWVMTSGGCVQGSGLLQVLFGAHNRDQWEESQVTYETDEYYVHEDLDFPEVFDNDIAVIKLRQPIGFNDYIQPVCLPSYTDAADAANFVNMDVTATGWGADTHGYHHALQYLNLKTISTQQCIDVYGEVITDLYLCTSGDRGIGACNGDTGSPLNYVKDGITYTRGIAVFWSGAGCGAGDPTGFTSISKHLDWISEKTGIAIDP
ncbi:brachyurin-like [Penaeus indicus]|uniref:brachyurin-like n=1 Tax=Penaeus indicus TaxID=29960 RepID=UPI00300C8B30